MKRWVFALLLLCSCKSTLHAQAVAANAVARSANAFAPLVNTAEEREQIAAVDSVATTCTASREQCRAEAFGVVEAIEREWQPIWRALTALAVAQDAWATALEHGSTGDAWKAVVSAVCVLAASTAQVAPELVAHVPTIPGGVCP